MRYLIVVVKNIFRRRISLITDLFQVLHVMAWDLEGGRHIPTVVHISSNISYWYIESFLGSWWNLMRIHCVNNFKSLRNTRQQMVLPPELAESQHVNVDLHP